MNDKVYGGKLEAGIKSYHRALQKKLNNDQNLVPVLAIGTLKDSGINSVTSNAVGAFIHAHYLSQEKNIVIHHGAHEQALSDTRKANEIANGSGSKGMSVTVDHGDTIHKSVKNANRNDYGSKNNPSDSLQSKISGVTSSSFTNALRSKHAGNVAVIAHLNMEQFLNAGLDKHQNLTSDRRPTTIVDYQNIQEQNLDYEIDQFIANQKELVDELGGEKLFYERIQARLESDDGLSINKHFERRPVIIIPDISSLKKSQ